MELRLEDLQTEEQHNIDAGGATLGRDSRRSSITIPDPGVSGAHARIFSRAGRYYIEDTNSSNGTFVEGTRLRGELELKDGIVIALHKYKFRVSAVNGAESVDNTGLYEQKAVGAKTAPSATPRSMQQARTVMHEEPEDAQVEGEDEALREGSSIHRNVPIGEGESDAPARRDSSSVPAARRRDSGSTDRRDSGTLDRRDTNEPSGPRRREIAVDEENEESSREISNLGPAFNSGDMQGGIGKAIAYYMGAVPKLALGPVSATQQLLAEQPFAPMDKMDLVVWAAPPLLLGAIIQLVATIILSLVTHTFGFGAIMNPLIFGAITVVVGSVVAGWVWHPLFDWWFRLLKGESNPRGRTNMFVGVYTGMALVQVVSGIGVLFALLASVPVVGPFIQIVPLVLSLGAGLVTLYILYAWHGHFRVMDLVPKIIMVLGVLLVASTAWSAIGVIRASVASANALAASKKAEETVAAAQAEAARLQGDAQSRTRAAQAQGTTADSATAMADKSGTEGVKPATTSPSASPTTNDRAAVTTATPAVTTSPTPPPTTHADGRSQPSRVEATDDDAPPPPRPAAHGGRPTFAELNEHIDNIEKAVAADPSLLARMENALNLYKKMHATQAKYKTKSKDPVAERIRQAELYGALVDTVEELYEKVAR